MFRTTCATCRMLRRFMLSFCAGVLLMWQFTGSLPADGTDQGAWNGFMYVAIFFLAASVLLRMREMKARLRRLSA